MSNRTHLGVGFQEPNTRKENSAGCGVTGKGPEALERGKGGKWDGRGGGGGGGGEGESKLIIFMVHLPQSVRHSHIASDKGRGGGRGLN